MDSNFDFQGFPPVCMDTARTDSYFVEAVMVFVVIVSCQSHILKSSFQFNNTIYTQNPFLSTDLTKGKHTCFNHSITKGWFCSGHVLKEKRIGHVSWNVDSEGTILMGGVPEWDFFEWGAQPKE